MFSSVHKCLHSLFQKKLKILCEETNNFIFRFICIETKINYTHAVKLSKGSFCD